MDTGILEQIGLSKNEIKVYFALLELDQSSATPIVKKSGIPNSKVYPTIEKLIQKGLVSYVIKNNVKYFQASDPNNLIEFLDDKEKQIIEQKSKIEDLIPKIELKRKLAKEKQESVVYEGLDGIKAAFNEILHTLKEGEEYYVFALDRTLARKDLILFFNNYHIKRIQKKIKVRLIANKNIQDIFKPHHMHKGMKVKYTRLNLPTGIFIFKNNVMTVVWGETPTAFIIKSKNNYERYKEFFEEMWKTSKR